MTTVSDVAAALQTILTALPDVDKDSIDDYLPAIGTRKIALLIVPFEQDGTMSFAGTGKYQLVHAHRIPCEFWIKVQAGHVDDAMQRGRDTCLLAMRLLAANPTLNGTVQQLGSSFNGTQGQIGTYNVLPRISEKGVVDYVIARLLVPVEIREVGTW